MCRSLRLEPTVRPLMLALCLVSSCGLIDLRPVSVGMYPDTADAMLPTRDTTIRVWFDCVPDRLEAERSFMVSDSKRTIAGDFSWEDRSFVWKPVVPWSPGVRYRVRFEGTIRVSDGREARPAFDIPFYAVHLGGRPVVVGAWPDSEASIEVPLRGQPILRLKFSDSMDVISVERELGIQPSCESAMTWNEDRTEATMIATARLSPCVGYRWTLGTGATAVDGTPLAVAVSGTFRTDAEGTAPTVERVYAVCRSGDSWTELAPDIDSLDTGQSIGIRFSREMDAATLRSGIRLEPAHAGIMDLPDLRTAIFTPEHGWPPELALVLVVSAGVTDLSGLSLGREYRRSFVPATPYLEVTAVETAEGERATCFSGSSVLATSPGTQPDGIVSLAVFFSAPFEVEAMIAAARLIHLTALFPSDTPSPAIRSITWPSSDVVVVAWEGLRPSDAISTIYYRLAIDGGAAGIESDGGLHLRDDAVLLLEMSE